MVSGNKPKPNQRLSYSDVEQNVRRESWQSCKNELRITVRFLNVFLEGFFCLQGKPIPGIEGGELTLAAEKYILQILFLSRSFSGIRCALELAQWGHYVHAAQLIRHALEDLVVCRHCERDQKLPGQLLKGMEGRLNFTNLAREEGAEFEQWWRHGYYELSEIAHPRSQGAWMTIPRDNGLRIGPYFDRNILLGTIDYILKILLPYGEIMTGVIELNAPLSLTDWEQKAFLITTEVHSILDEIEKKLAAASLSSEPD